MAEQKQQRRVEEVAPGLVRIVDGDTYVYLASGSAEFLVGTGGLSRSEQPTSQPVAPNG